ncbi:MAG: methyltransferase domain-containing protein [Candidatus Neomarinimicrobiota bacterium]
MMDAGVERERIKKWFDRRYAEKGLRSMRSYEAYPVFLDHLSVQSEERLLDMGCGTGFLLKEACDRGLESYGVDLSPEAIRLSKGVSPRAHLSLGMGEHLCFEDKSFDYVTCIGTLEHFVDMEKGLREIRRVAGENARFCFMIPNSDSLLWRISSFLGTLNDDSNENGCSLKSWSKLFSDNGFEIIVVHRDRWYIRKILSLMSPASFSRFEEILLRLFKLSVPLKFANQLVFLLKKKNVRMRLRPAKQPDGINEIGRMYDRLTRFTLLTNLVRSGDLYAGFGMHKILRPLRDFLQGGGKTSRLTYLEDLALSLVDLPPDPTVLDAGCGFGGTIFRWHEQVGGEYDGITLSPVQVSIARREARRRGIDSSCRFYLRDFDDPLRSQYDAVIAIESLIHSPNFERTIGSITGELKPGGYLVAVDDVQADGGETGSHGDVDALKQYWQLSEIPSEKEYRRAFDENDLRLVHEFDLSEQIEFTGPRLVSIIDAICRFLHATVPVLSVRSVLSAQLGGFALQRLYGRKFMHYKLFVGEKLSGVSTSG